MKTQRHCEHAGSKANVVVEPVRRTAVMMQSGNMRAYQFAEVRKRIDISGHWIWFVLINRRGPIDGQATQNEAEEDWHVEPVAASHERVVSANHTHAGLILRHACSDHLTEMGGTSHTYSPR